MAGKLRNARHWALYAGVRALQGTATVVPRRLGLPLFAGIGDVVRVFDRPAVRTSRANLARALGHLPESEREQLMREMFRAMGRNVFDLLRLRAFDARRAAVRIEGEEWAHEAYARGRGVVALSAHCGNWEILAATMAQRGFPVHAVARRLFDPRLDRLMNDWRESAGVRIHDAAHGLREACRVLRRGEILATLPDQDTSGPAAFVDFFGHPAKTPTMPFRLARSTGAALLPILISQDEHGTHCIRVWPALVPSTAADESEAIRADIAAWHRILEDFLREHPAQWVWFHRRWKSKPPTGRELAAGDAILESIKEPEVPQTVHSSKELVNAR